MLSQCQVEGGGEDETTEAEKRRSVPLTHPGKCHTQPSDHQALDFLGGKKSMKGYPPEKQKELIYVLLQKESSHWAKNIKENTSVVSPTITLKPFQIPHTHLASYQK